MAEIEIESCSECPFRMWDWVHVFLKCALGGLIGNKLPRVPPQDCPLRKAPVTLTVKIGKDCCDG